MNVKGILLLVIAIFPAWAQKLDRPVPVEIRATLAELLKDEDTDEDTKITVDDPHIAGTDRGDKRFWVRSGAGRRFEVSGTFYLSNLLQELKLAEEAGHDTALLEPKRIFEHPVDRMSRMIREYYWDGLTRRMDEEGILTILKDEKTETVDGSRFLYVPPSDDLAHHYFTVLAKTHPKEKIKVVRLPDVISADYVRQLDLRHGILTLDFTEGPQGELRPLPFVVPGGRFNEMYGWDSYFITLGLLEDGRMELAKAMVDHFVYEITHYGKILNANRTYYLTRSQPPFLTSMIRAVHRHMPKNPATKSWLRNSLEAAIKEYLGVWTATDHLTGIGLSRYFDIGYGVPPEVEPGHFDALFQKFAAQYKMDARSFERAYRSGKLSVPELDEYFVHDRAMRESGHDTSYRLEGRCANLATVDLNALLYKFETDIASLIEQEFHGSLTTKEGVKHTTKKWTDRALHRKQLMNRYLWNEKRGMFFDYDVVNGEQTGYVSATTLYPLWAELATSEQAAQLVRNALPSLQQPGGIAGSSEESRGPVSSERPLRQWDFPYGWAPHQMLVWQGLLNYTYTGEAHRLIYSWLYTLTSNAVKYHGTIPEKFDVEKRSHQVFAEYGNVGTVFAYITREGFGWTNASYQVGLALLPARYRSYLNDLIPPEWVF